MGPAGKILPDMSINIWNPALKLLLLPKKKLHGVVGAGGTIKGEPEAATSATVPEM